MKVHLTGKNTPNDTEAHSQFQSFKSKYKYFSQQVVSEESQKICLVFLEALKQSEAIKVGENKISLNLLGSAGLLSAFLVQRHLKYSNTRMIASLEK